jgi:hypothetical protein
MLTAVDFNDNFGLMTGKVGKVTTDSRLAPKVMLLERRLSQMLPQFLFRFGRVTTQGTCAGYAVIDRSRRSFLHLAPPTPDPSPPRATRAEGGEQVRARRMSPFQNAYHDALPASVWTQASPQAFARSRTRPM